MYDKSNSADMLFFEMYADENAYQAHLDTLHFQKYFHSTKDMITTSILLEAVPVELKNKHNTPSDK